VLIWIFLVLLAPPLAQLDIRTHKKTYVFKGSWADPLGGATPVRMVIRSLSLLENRESY
jgi:hypothetical protein